MPPSLTLTVLRGLDLRTPSAPGRPSHLSAASGLVSTERHLYVVADDELHLGVFPQPPNLSPGALLRLLPGELPLDPAERKARKPDFEVLTHLPAFAGYPCGGLLAFGSGSRPSRMKGALLPLDETGAPAGPALPVDAAELLQSIGVCIGPVNIEGAVVIENELFVLNRGDAQQCNAILRTPMAQVLPMLGSHGRLPGVVLTARSYDLGSEHGIPYGFTDGASLGDGRLVFSAVAEDRDDAYQDGPLLGARVGVIDAQGELQALWPVEPAYKLEGIAARRAGDLIELLLVSDADDVRQPGVLCRTEII